MIQIKTKLLRVPLLLFCIFLSSCKSNKDLSGPVLPADTLYNNGVKLLGEGKYIKASREFEEVFLHYVGTPIAKDAELMQAYALYLGEAYESASDILEIFLALHPHDKYAAYAQYMRALAGYAQVVPVKLDQAKAELTKQQLEIVMDLFPGTKYAADAALKLPLVKDNLAAKEMFVGRFYLARNAPIAALNRFQRVLKLFADTNQHQEALYRMVETTLMLGLRAEARSYVVALHKRYPNGFWDKQVAVLYQKIASAKKK